MPDRRYLTTVYGLARLAGRAPAGARATARVLARETVCWLVGHEPSWVLAVQAGVKGGPVCERCLTPLGGGRGA
jgi:hypothetical protein